MTFITSKKMMKKSWEMVAHKMLKSEVVIEFAFLSFIRI